MINSVLKGNLAMLCLKLDLVICVGSFLLSSNIVMVENFYSLEKGLSINALRSTKKNITMPAHTI